jgi:hypothetical protein
MSETNVDFDRLVMRPGKGWKHLGGAVYERLGVRVHLQGLCKLPNGEFVHGNNWPEFKAMARMIKINGGNRKRGMMAWARNLAGT